MLFSKLLAGTKGRRVLDEAAKLGRAFQASDESAGPLGRRQNGPRRLLPESGRAVCKGESLFANSSVCGL